MTALLVFGPALPVSAAPDDAVAAAIRARLDGTAAAPRLPGAAANAAELRTFYRARGFRPVWTDGSQATARARAALAMLGRAAAEGLEPADYAVAEITEAMAPRTADARADLDLLLSAALASYGDDLHSGRVRPDAVGVNAFTRKPGLDLADMLARAAAAPSLTASFSALAPQTPQYRRLRRALAIYRGIADRGGWPTLAAGPGLRVGMRDARVAVLRNRLAATGDAPAAAAGGELFDAALDAAVRRFQWRHGLAVDGVVGPRTRDALNHPVDDRIAQIRLNLERRRWMPADLGRRYVFVNAADFLLKVVDGPRTVLDMRVVVGTPYRRTPVFSATMTYLQFNPYWNIPPRIAREEILPKVRRDPDYLAAQGIRVFSDWSARARQLDPAVIDWSGVGGGRFPYRLRQDPGPLNPLGRVKFMFPNRFDVYLHDTPSRALFGRDVRTFSHGCIRIEKPAALAAYLLGGDGWTERDVLDAMAAGAVRTVRLSRPVPVHITYLTAWVNKDGSVHFRGDVYGRDRLLAAAIRRVARPAAPAG